MPFQRSCAFCNKTFNATHRKRGKYCSIDCAAQSRKKIVTGTCVICGMNFIKKGLNDPQKTCSPMCGTKLSAQSRRDPNKTKTVQCPICGKIFSDLVSQNQIYCSQKCGARGRKGYPHPKKRKPDNFISITCIVCGKSVIVHKCQTINGRNRKYCSRKCQGNHYAFLKKGSGNPMYIDGSSVNKISNRGQSWHKQRKAAFRRDNEKCQICGNKQRKGYKPNIDVHHIIPYRKFNGNHNMANQLNNLITLCKQCHAKVEHGYLACPIPLL